MIRPVALYDDECGFCKRSIDVVRRWPLQVDFRPLQTEPLADHGISRELAVREMAFVQVDGTVCFGHLAWAEILRTGPVPWRAAGWLLGHRPLSSIARQVYAWVARNRHRLPAGTATCELPRTDG